MKTPARELIRSARYHKTTGASAAILRILALDSSRLSIKAVQRLSLSDQEPAAADIGQRSLKGRCVSRRPHNLKINVFQLVEHRPGGVEELESNIVVPSPSLQEQ